jgi:hypothetical protein
MIELVYSGPEKEKSIDLYIKRVYPIAISRTKSFRYIGVYFSTKGQMCVGTIEVKVFSREGVNQTVILNMQDIKTEKETVIDLGTEVSVNSFFVSFLPIYDRKCFPISLYVYKGALAYKIYSGENDNQTTTRITMGPRRVPVLPPMKSRNAESARASAKINPPAAIQPRSVKVESVEDISITIQREYEEFIKVLQDKAEQEKTLLTSEEIQELNAVKYEDIGSTGVSC